MRLLPSAKGRQMADDDESDRTGYGRPPRSHQFKPGQSGNPAGRPRKKKPRGGATEAIRLTELDRVILREARRPVRVREGEQVFELSQQEALIRSVNAKAIKGSPMAQRLAVAENQRVQELERRRKQEIWDSWRSYATDWHRAAARASAQCKPFPQALPHPADIHFADDGCVYVTGPTTAEELKQELRTADFRDLFLAMYVYRICRWPVDWTSEDHVDPWSFVSFAFNALLPPSLRLSSDELHARSTNLVVLRLRTLEQHISDLCARLDWTLKIALLLARPHPIPIGRLGFQRVRGKIQRGPRVSRTKFAERLWAKVPFDHLTREKLDLLESLGPAGPPSWMTKVRAAIAA